MIICGMEKYSMVDYPDKIACTVFTLSCNFRCSFCQNSALVIPGREHEIISEEEVFSYIIKRKNMLDAVCISGGEPTLQKDLADFIKKVKEKTGLLVKLDTNGTNPAVLKDLYSLNLLDFVAMDIKNAPSNYGNIIGLPGYDTSLIKESVRLIMDSGIPYEFRTTLVNEYHSESDMAEIGELLKGASSYKLQKFEDKGDNIAGGLHAVSIEKAKAFADILRPFIPNVSLRNYD